jgi:hypothetical protein
MKIVINSHIKGEKALTHILESMRSCEEFNEYEILVFIGGYYHLNGYDIKKDDNITYIHCNHNSIDFTGLISLMELYSKNIDDYYLYLHDTCKVGPNFYKKIKSINLTNITSIKIKRFFSMNIGVYSQKLINLHKDFLLSKKNTLDSKCMEFKSVNYNEDFLFKNDPNNIVLNNYNGYIKTKPLDYYKTGTMRIIEYYPNLDLYKIKANWGQGTWTLDN